MSKKLIAIILVIGLVVAGALAFVYFKGLKTADIGTVQNSEPSPAATLQKTATLPVADSNVVAIENFAFSPAVLKIKAGQKVVWKQNDAATHTVVSANDLFSSGALQRGDEFSFVFNQVGEYDYHCGIHPSMTGKIIVK